MAYKAEHVVTFDAARTIAPIYTGGTVALSKDGSVLATTIDEDVILSTLATGSIITRIEGDGEAITTLALSGDGEWLITCSRSLSMRIYSLDETATLRRTLKPHTSPVVTLTVDSTNTLLATGGADGIIKVWDIAGGYTTHTFHGHSGLVTALHFFELDVKSGDTTGYRLASGDEEGKIRIWDLHKRKCVSVLDSHVSVIRGLEWSFERQLLISGSRDKTVTIWTKSWQPRSTIPILEEVESVGFVGEQFYTGGSRGHVRMWDINTGAELTSEQEAGTETEGIVQILSAPSFLVSVHADQVLKVFDLKSLKTIRQMSGTHDEVIDLAYVGRDRDRLALATNLEDIRLISLSDNYFGADVGQLRGHTDIIITIAVDWSGCWLATGAKDNTAKLWRLDSNECYATFTGHAESVGAVALPSNAPPVDSAAYTSPFEHPPLFLITGSTDKTVKRWDVATGRAKYTRKAHDKGINAVATSYHNPPLFASASQDRTVKIWDVETGEATGVLRGHKRGVWTVAFSTPGTANLTTSVHGAASGNKGMVLTGSGDKTVRIWNLNDYSCIRTFEGHANSILKVVWVPQAGARKGVQVASAAGDGLVKLWDAESGECATTLDNHIDRVWALTVKSNAEPVTLVSGSADSTITFWSDTTELSAQEATSRATARVEQDQELQNHIRSSNYREAIVLALQLNHPKRLLEIFTKVIESEHEADSFIGKVAVDEALRELSDAQLWSLLLRCRDWNANVRTSQVAQRILWTLFHLYPKEHLLRLRAKKKASTDTALAEAMAELTTIDKRSQRESIKDVLDALKAYTDRHDQRLAKLGEERFVLTWALQCIDGYSSNNDVAMING